MAYEARPELGVAALALLLGVTGLFVGALYRRTGYLAINRSAVSFLQHLSELRARLLRLALLFGYWLVLLLTFRFEPVEYAGLRWPSPVADVFDNAAAGVFAYLAHHAVPSGVQVVVQRPTEAVAALVQVALLIAFALTLPALGYELWAFFAPALRAREQQLALRALPAAVALFLTGAAFSYVYIVPMLFRVLYGFASPIGALPLLSAGALVGTLVTFALLFGLAFQLPLLMALLSRLGFASAATFVRHWRGATVAVFVVAAIVTDPTLVSQLIVGALLLALYWSGVLASWLARSDAAQGRRVRGRLSTG